MTIDFNDYFWGDKNNGFDVLYHNMKYGLVASKELSDFFREKSNIEEHNSKFMTKLANKAGSGCVNGTFAPIWVVLKSSAERLAQLHLQMVQKISELVKDVSKYADELHKKHKSVKEEESGTIDSVQAMQTSTVALQKSKDLYISRMNELDKLKKDNGSQKDLEKSETKLRKQHDDYKSLLDKHIPVKAEFERRMTITCKRFQEIEENHLKQMKEFLSTYIELLQNNHDMVGQVHSEFKRQFLEMTVDKLLEQFVLTKYTGLEKPEIVEVDISNWTSGDIGGSPHNLNHSLQQQQQQQQQQQSSAVTSATQSPSSVVVSTAVITAPPTSKPLLRNWFSSSSSSSNTQNTSASQAQTSQLSPIKDNDNDQMNTTPDHNVASGGGDLNVNLSNQIILPQIPIDINDGNGSQIQATNTTTQLPPSMSNKIDNGDSNINDNQIMAIDQNKYHQHHQQQQQQQQHQQLQQQQQQSQQPQKSSRRTTSLLNLFMSNSQGSRDSRVSRDSSSIEVLSAPTSPTTATTASIENSLHIGRNPLRGSKFSAILRSGRNKTKTKKNKKKKDSSDTLSQKDEHNSVVEEKDENINDTIESSCGDVVIGGGGGGGIGSGTTGINTNDLLTGGNSTGLLNITNSSIAPPSVAISAPSSTTMTSNASAISNIIGTSSASNVSSSATGSGLASGVPDVDEDGYSIQPKDPKWDSKTQKKEMFYSDSDSDTDNDEQERKIRVEIKPLNNGTAPISASVDELRATVENLSLSPLGGALSARRGSNSESDSLMKRSHSVSQQYMMGDNNKPSNDLLGLNLFQQHQSPGASNASTPTTNHPYGLAGLQSPTLSVTNTSTARYADLGDIFSSEMGEISASAPASANLTKITNRQIPTPTSTSGNSIAIPRPPSRRSDAAVRGRVSPSTISRADSVGSLEFRTASIGIGSSRGPSPLTIGMSDTIPIAVAYHEVVHAYFRGSDESRCQVKMSGDLMVSFPAGIVNVLANNPNPAKLNFRIKNIQNLDNIMPNKQLLTIDKAQSTNLSALLEFNMPALTALLRRQSEQNPTASYFNVDILKYQIKSKQGAVSCPFQLVCYWKCETTHTDLKIDYKYNSHAMATASPLLNVAISVPVDGGVKNVQSKPHSAWMGESNRLVWNFTDISQHSDNNGVGTLRARLEVSNGPSIPSMLATQFNCEGTTLSGIEFELVGSGYRLSLVKRRFVSGKYICEGDGIRNSATPTPTPPSATSPSLYNM